MADDSGLEVIAAEGLVTIRDQFKNGDYEAVASIFEGLGPIGKVRSGIRVEATVLAARAKTALGHKKEATALLKKEWGRTFTSARLYGYLAIACIELGDYERAATLSGNAAELKRGKAAAERS